MLGNAMLRQRFSETADEQLSQVFALENLGEIALHRRRVQSTEQPGRIVVVLTVDIEQKAHGAAQSVAIVQSCG
jgi:hypothetical protein